MSHRFYHLAFFLLLSITGALAQQDFPELVSALESQDGSYALKLAQKLESQEELSFGLFYNKGLALRDQGDLPQARAAFERALTYSPRDLATRRRLREVKERLNPQIAENDVVGTPLWSRHEAESALLLLSLGLLALGLARLAGREITGKQIIAPAGALLLVAGVLWAMNPAPDRAVVTTTNSKLLAKPEGSSQGQALQPGLMVNVLERKTHFLKLETGDGRTGWVREAEITRI